MIELDENDAAIIFRDTDGEHYEVEAHLTEELSEDINECNLLAGALVIWLKEQSNREFVIDEVFNDKRTIN